MKGVKNFIPDPALILLWTFLVLFGVACSGSDSFQRGKDKPSSYSSIFLKGEGVLEFKLVDESLSDDRLRDLVSEVRNKNHILEGSYDAKTVSEINQALGSQIPAGTEIAYELHFDPIDSKKIDKALPLLLVKKAVLTGDSLQSAKVGIKNSMPYVFLQFNPQGAEDFKVVTGQNISKRLAILVDGTVYVVPKIESTVPDGKAQLRFGVGEYQRQFDEADDLVRILRRRYHLEPEKKSWLDRLFH